ncbi:hypothetical protein HRI_003372900 [Hibiscus trionum]|uniref:Transcription initiation factor TFIID subunit 10 n=1 Tax=Hibiscus trionum TaxID=183268 RepID=A0A9W7IKP4_HIBTR|nr:hypothetical protein HRI_003372600 [Hibiscus trionum]GMI97036.1 hypothetical protein HRI_003372900 [Hibiscus trionum]
MNHNPQSSDGKHDDDSVLSDFLASLMDYTPTIPDGLVEHYLSKSGFQSPDVRLTPKSEKQSPRNSPSIYAVPRRSVPFLMKVGQDRLLMGTLLLPRAPKVSAVFYWLLNC